MMTKVSKTWGPSTLHQRERGHLPELCDATQQWQPNSFSKSAPNLDKTRMIGGGGIQTTISSIQNSTINSTTGGGTSYGLLGKSYEGLNILCKKRGDVGDHSHNYDDDEVGGGGGDLRDDDDDDDDEIISKKGCFPFIRSDQDSSASSSMLNESNNGRKLLKSSTKSKSKRHYQISSHNNSNNSNFRSNTNNNSNLDNVIYDKGFYRGIEKSLEEIFSHNGEQTATTMTDDDFFVEQRHHNTSYDDSQLSYYQRHQNRDQKVSSKSSNDLSMYGTTTTTRVGGGGGVGGSTITTTTTTRTDNYESNYRFQRFGSDSKFRRECFFNTQSKSLDFNDTDTTMTTPMVMTTDDGVGDEGDEELDNLSANLSTITVSHDHYQHDGGGGVGGGNNNNSISISSSRKNSVTFSCSNDDSFNSSIGGGGSGRVTGSSNYIDSTTNSHNQQSINMNKPRKFKINTNYQDLTYNNSCNSSSNSNSNSNNSKIKELHPKSSLRCKIEKTKQLKTKKHKTINFAKYFNLKTIKNKTNKTTKSSIKFYGNYVGGSSGVGVSGSGDDGNEQRLLDDISGTTLVEHDEDESSHYEAIYYTRNFVLGRQNSAK